MIKTEFEKFIGMITHTNLSGIKFTVDLDKDGNPTKVTFPYKKGDVNDDAVVTPTDENWGTDMFGLVSVKFGDRDKGLQSGAKAFHMILDHIKCD